ncbi:hypothetical protein Bca4012_082314 [Brassica carinata]
MLSPFRSHSRSFSLTLSMESPEAASSGFPPLPPEPPDPDLDVMLPFDPPPLLMHPLLAKAALSSFFTSRLASSFLQLIPVPKPRNLVPCGEHVSSIEIFVARFLRLMTADFKLTSLHYTSLQVLEDWTSKVEILAVVSLRYAASLTSVQPIEVHLFTALSSSLSKVNRHLKPLSHMVRTISPCFMLSQGKVFVSCWSESFLFDHCLRKNFNSLSRRSLFPGKQEIMLFLNGSVSLIEEFINLLIFRFKLSLPQCEAVIWISVFVAMDAIVSGLSNWPWWFASQQPIFWKRGLVASELVDVSFPVGYVENFPTCSANGTWIVISIQSAKAVLLQKTSHSTLSSGLSSLQIQADTTVPFFALRSGLVLIEITGFYIVRNLVPLVIPLSCSYILCKTFCLVVVVLVMGEVPKLCVSSTLF